MTQKNKKFDAVKTMRKIRDGLSRCFEGMTFAEQKRAMQEAACKPKQARLARKTVAKHTK